MPYTTSQQNVQKGDRPVKLPIKPPGYIVPDKQRSGDKPPQAPKKPR